jgi:amino acid transporter
VALLVLVCALLTGLNVVGTRHAMRGLGGLTVLKLLPLLTLVGAGLWLLDASALLPGAAPAPDRIGTAVMLSIYAFVGWESALVPGGEARHPARDMPRALLWCLAATTLLYVAIQAVSVAAVPDLAGTAERPLVAVGQALLGAPGALLLTLGVVASVAGNVASSTLSTPRITYALAREGLLPRFFGGVHARFRTPAASILIYGALYLALAVSGTFVELAKISVMTRLLIYLAVVAAIPRLRQRQADAPGRLILPGGLIVPGLAALVCLALLLQVGWPTVWRTLLYLAVGTLLYLVARRQGSPPS